MDNFLFWFIFSIIILVIIIAPIAVIQIAQIGFIIGRDGTEEE